MGTRVIEDEQSRSMLITFIEKHKLPMTVENKRRRARPGEANASFVKAMSSSEKSECILWEFAVNRNGYAIIRWNGEKVPASRLMCILTHGEPPIGKNHAAHSCGNGHLGCINQHHLSWKTPKENTADSIAHGTHVAGEDHPNSKLTVKIVRSIRRSSVPAPVLAIRHGVSRSSIQNVLKRKTWKHVQ